MPTSLSAGDVVRHVAVCRSFRPHFDRSLANEPRVADQTQLAAAVADRAQEIVCNPPGYTQQRR
jgi:hypothetical protein